LILEPNALRDAHILADFRGAGSPGGKTRLRIDADRFDHERVALPMTDGRTHIGVFDVRRKRAAIGVDTSEHAHLAGERDATGGEEKLDAIHEAAAVARELQRTAP